MLTLNELCERLKHIDEISLMEVLEINSDDLLLDFEAEFDEIEE